MCAARGNPAPDLPLIDRSDRRMLLTGISLSAVCVAYTCLLDRVLFSSAHFSLIFRLLLTVYDSRTAWLAMAVCLLAALWNRPAAILRVVDCLGHHPRSAALLSTALLAAGAIGVYQRYPLSMDEYAAVFQAKIFASGHIYAQLPREVVEWLVVRGFNGSFLIASLETGKAVEEYWPGFALLLAPFEVFGLSWVCNACLSGGAMLLIYWIAREISGDRRAGGWALLFTLTSGVFVADGLSYYSMQAHLTANLLYVALLIRPGACRAMGAGLIGSLALILHNPVPHTLFAIPWIVSMAMDRNRLLLPLILGYAPGVAAGLGWIIFRSDIASAAHGAATVSAVTAGVFGWPDSTSMNMRAGALAKMWLWASPCLFIFAVSGRFQYRDNKYARLLMQSAILTFSGYLFVRFDQGHGWGYRYFHSAWGAIPVLAGCAMLCRADGPQRRISFAGAAAILNLLIVIPFQMHEISEVISQHLAQLTPPTRPGNNVYFIHPAAGFYLADMVQIDPLLRDRDLRLVSRGTALDTQLIRRNWPNAVQISNGGAADQWWLGSQDQRVPIPGTKDQKSFVFRSDAIVPVGSDFLRPTATNSLYVNIFPKIRGKGNE